MDVHIFTVVSQKVECIKLVLLPVCSEPLHTTDLKFPLIMAHGPWANQVFSVAIHPVTFS